MAVRKVTHLFDNKTHVCYPQPLVNVLPSLVSIHTSWSGAHNVFSPPPPSAKINIVGRADHMLKNLIFLTRQPEN